MEIPSLYLPPSFSFSLQLPCSIAPLASLFPPIPLDYLINPLTDLPRNTRTL